MKALFLGTLLVLSPLVALAEDNGYRQATELSRAFEEVADKITPSVVNISATKKAKKSEQVRRDPFYEFFKDQFGDEFMSPYQNPDQFAQQGMGTGVVIDSDGHILTNNHVAGDADELTVTMHNGKSYKAKLIGSDPRSDLAVIKIKARDLVPAQLGNSDELRIGEWVIACGNPFGLDNTITAGIVSAKGRSVMGGTQYEDFIQTDAAINPGNSGGPLVNLKGEVVGINTAIFSRNGGYMGIGFAIPSNMAKQIVSSLIKKGKVVRGWLGIGIQNLTEELAESFNYADTDGALVGYVEPGGPADKAGIKQGDIVISLNGERKKNLNILRNSIAAVEPGSKVKVEVIRDGETKEFTVKVGELPNSDREKPTSQEEETSDLGLVVQSLTPETARRLGSERKNGVIVSRVFPGSPAESSGIQPRDIIVSVNGKVIEDAQDFEDVISRANLKKGVRLVVETQGMERFVFLRNRE